MLIFTTYYLLNILLLWISLTLIFGSVGLALLHFIGFKIINQSLLLFSPWLGWAGLIAYLQIWNLFASVNFICLGIFIGVAVACAVWLTYSHRSEIGRARMSTANLIAFIFYFVTTLWIANLAISPQLPYDAGLYHIQAIRWIQEYSIVPGLGNLHGRFAFNNSYFLFLAFLDNVPRSDGAYYLGSGLLLSLLGLVIAFPASKAVFHYQEATPTDFLSLFFLIPFIYACIAFATSTGAEMPVYAIGLLMSLLLCEIILGRLAKQNLAVLFMLGAVGITIKVSIVVFVFTSCIIGLLQLARAKLPTAYWIKIMIIPLSLCAIWVVRNVILSGYIIYPFPWFSLPVVWKIPQNQVIGMLQIIKSWARQPMRPSYEVLGNWNWLIPWMKENFAFRQAFFFLPVFAMPINLVMVWMALRQKEARDLFWFVGLSIPNLLSIIYWFLMAPDPRFLGPELWVNAFVTAIFIFRGLNRSMLSRVVVVSVICFLGIYCGNVQATLFNDRPQFISPEMGRVETREFISRFGVKMYLPPDGEDRCYDSPLPCTPYPAENLRLLDGKNIQSGFIFVPQ